MTTPPPSPDTPRETEIDGLRAIAILGVLVTHYMFTDTNWGHLGVRLFFVISGYLITRILLNARPAPGGNARQAFTAFYARRFFRIVPAYMLMLAATVLVYGFFGVAPLLANMFFVSNLYYVAVDGYRPWVLTHTWSLSVEEQFYLFWPLLVLLLDRRWLETLAWFGVALSAAYALVRPFGDGALATELVTFASFDALFGGALLALSAVRNGTQPAVLRGLLWPAVLVAIAIQAWPLAALAADERTLGYLDEALPVLAFVALVSGASAGRLGTLGALLRWPPIAWIGRISYGIYLYHVLVELIFFRLLELFGIEGGPGVLTFVICTPATVALAALSWRYLETPLITYARRFRYRGGEAVSGQPAARP